MSADPNAGPDVPRCFIAMPITTHPDEVTTYADEAHWSHVMEMLLVPAVKAAGYEPIRPVAQGSHMIHGEIVKNLAYSEMVLFDLSQSNPNVYFELGVRTSLNKPVTLVKDRLSTLQFDTSGINTHDYDQHLRAWTLKSEVSQLAEHISKSAKSCHGQNPMWRHFGVQLAAEAPSSTMKPGDAKLDLLAERVDQIARDTSRLRHSSRSATESAGLSRSTISQVTALIASHEFPEVVGVSGAEDEVTVFYLDRPSQRLLGKLEEFNRILDIPVHLQRVDDHPDRDMVEARVRAARAQSAVRESDRQDK